MTQNKHWLDHDQRSLMIKVFSVSIAIALKQNPIFKADRFTFAMNEGCIGRLLQVFDNLFYVILSILGCYFIHKGEVFNRFRFGKTFFAEYDEQVSELPTILTYIEGPSRSNLKYGKDFNLSLAWGKLRIFIGEEEDPSINILNLGENSIPFGTEIDIENMFGSFVGWNSVQNIPSKSSRHSLDTETRVDIHLRKSIS